MKGYDLHFMVLSKILHKRVEPMEIHKRMNENEYYQLPIDLIVHKDCHKCIAFYPYIYHYLTFSSAGLLLFFSELPIF